MSGGDSGRLDVLVVGAGAAGLFAATEAAAAGARTLLVEKNRRPGVKILASGGSRCNVTSTLPIDELGRWFGRRGERFLRHGLHAIGPAQIRERLAEDGVLTGEFPLEKVFPLSGRAADVLRAFLARLDRSGAALALGEGVRAVERQGDGFRVITTNREIETRRLVLAPGGRSYPRTGTVGEGYGWLAGLGHAIVTPRPALAPLVVDEPGLRALAGVSVEDATVRVVDDRNRRIFERRRPILFTHRGLSGPAAMDASTHLGIDGRRLQVDWLPGVDPEAFRAALDDRRDGTRRLAAQVPGTLARRLLAALFSRAGVPEDRRIADLRRDERDRFLRELFACEIPVSGNEGYDKAEVTAGGQSLDEIDPRSMESRLVPGLHVAGELLDLDGPIGGFNFQAAFSTGFLAGRAAARRD